MLSVVMLSVVMLSVVMLSVVMLSVVMLSVVMLIVVAPFFDINKQSPYNHCRSCLCHPVKFGKNSCTVKLSTVVIKSAS
jgi:hypothetical protein